jgi:CRP/FNR family transcriptional regulator, cyclic AMP receptor protein
MQQHNQRTPRYDGPREVASPMARRGISGRSINLESFGLLGMEWASLLTAELRRRVISETTVRRISADAFVCRKGEPVTAWIGVLTGLVKLGTVLPNGRSVGFTGISAGGWFGEGSLLKDEPRLYEAVALRDSAVAYLPRNTFALLLDRSMPFNRFLLNQLNERLGQFIGMVERDRALGPEARLATELAALFNPHLYPGNRDSLSLTQEELASLVGLSRQRVNVALKRLSGVGLIRVETRGVTILDLEGLKQFQS